MRVTLKTIMAMLLLCLAAVAACEQVADKHGGPPVPTNNASLSAAVPLPASFTVCFFLGYADDHLPRDPAAFDSLLAKLAASGFTVVHGTYADWRIEACRKRGIKFMIDMVAPDIDYRNAANKAKAEDLCRKLRGNDAVWGYAVWYAGGCGARLNPVLEKFHAWDPTHPCFVGSKYCDGINELTVNPGVLAWEDLDWHENNPQHFADMMKMFRCNQKLGAQTGRWIVMAGPEKDRYTLHQSIAAGLKTVMWFIGGPWDRKTQQWVPSHYVLDIVKEIRPLYGELMRMGAPVAVYSTPVTRTAWNVEIQRQVPEPLVPVPADFWLRVEQGEALLGIYRYADGYDAVYAANHNAFAPQRMAITLKPGADGKPRRVEMFDRKNGGWKELEVKDGVVSFDLGPGGGELLRVKGGSLP